MTQNHTLETSGDGDGFTPGQHLQAISAAFFSGGGWVDPLTWDDYDAGGHAKWEEFARIVGTDIRRAVAAPEMFGELSYLADGNDWFGEQRFAEDTDADFLLRVLGAVRKRARAAVRKALGSDPQPIPVEGGDGSSVAQSGGTAQAPKSERPCKSEGGAA